MDDETASAMRGSVVRGVIARTSDEGETQVLDLETHDGVTRSEVEVHQPYGLATLAPEGAVTVVLGIGGDQGDLIALPPSLPGTRFGRLEPGEVVLYDSSGNRVHLRFGGVIEIHASTKVYVEAPEIVAKGNVTIQGDLVVTGQVSDERGSMQEMRDVYNGHTNPSNGGSAPPQKMN